MEFNNELSKARADAYEKARKAKKANEYFNQKNWIDGGAMSFMLWLFVFFLIAVIIVGFSKEIIPLIYRYGITMGAVVLTIIFGIVTFIKEKIRFYKVDEIVANFQNIADMNFYEAKGKALGDAIETIYRKEEMVHTLNKEYDIENKEYENIEGRLQFAKDKIKKKEKELETLSYKKSLYDWSRIFRDKKSDYLNVFIYTCLIFIFFFMFLSIPLMIATDKSQNDMYLIPTLIMALIPPIVVGVLYVLERKKRLKAFEILNKVGLSNDVDYYEESYKLKNEFERTRNTYSDFIEISYSFYENTKEETS